MEKAMFCSLLSASISGLMLVTISIIRFLSLFAEVLEYNYIKFVDIFAISLIVILLLILSKNQKSINIGKLRCPIDVILSIIVGIFLITYGIFQFSTGLYIIDNFGTEESCISYFPTIESAYNRAEKIMCHAHCPCKADKNYVNMMNNMNKSEPIDYKVFSNRHKGASSIFDCDPCYEIRLYNESSSSPSSALTSTEYYGLVNWIKDNLNQTVSSKDCNIEPDLFKNTYFSSDEIEYFSILNKIEKKYGCSGFCSEKYFFMFSDVNKGEPKKSCSSFLVDETKIVYIRIGVFNIVCGVFISLPLLILIFEFFRLICRRSYVNFSEK